MKTKPNAAVKKILCDSEVAGLALAGLFALDHLETWQLEALSKLDERYCDLCRRIMAGDREAAAELL